MTAAINILGFMCLLTIIAYKLRTRLVRALPAAVAALLVLLMPLGMMGCLFAIDYIFAGIIIATALLFIIKRRKVDVKYILELYSDTYFWAFVFSALLMAVLEWSRLARNWDELGCWAVEVKTLFLNGGFSSADMHTAVGYADYLPGQMLFEWWICHMHPGRFVEGLMFAGYYIFYFSLIAPAFSYIDFKKKTPAKAAGSFACSAGIFALLFVLPGCISKFEYEMLSVELLQSAAFGMLLITIFMQRLRKTEITDIVSFISLGIIMILLKDSSIIFLIMLFVFALCITAKEHKKGVLKEILLAAAFIVLVYVIWKSFVVLNHRGDTAKKTAGIAELIGKYIKGDYSDPNIPLYVKSYVKSMLFYPLHINKGILLDLYIYIAVLLVCTAIILLFRNKNTGLCRRDVVALEAGFFSMLGGYLILLLIMHVFGFRETQYLDPKTMMYTISRYAEPVLLGFILLVLYICMVHCKLKARLFAVVLILLFMDYQGAGRALAGYRGDVSVDISARETIRSNNEELFLKFDSEKGESEGRIRFIYNNETAEKNMRLFRYMLAPAAFYPYSCEGKADDKLINDLLEELKGNRYDYYYFRTASDELSRFGIEINRVYTVEEMKKIFF